jgi:hypothetical protein
MSVSVCPSVVTEECFNPNVTLYLEPLLTVTTRACDPLEGGVTFINVVRDFVTHCLYIKERSKHEAVRDAVHHHVVKPAHLFTVCICGFRCKEV